MKTGLVTAAVHGLGVLAAILIAGCSDGSDSVAIRAAIDRDLPTTVEQSERLPDYNIYRPQDMDATGTELPVIVWTSGGCFRVDTVWAGILQTWAASGFVAVAPTVPADSDGQAVGTTSVEDQAAVIDWILAENERVDSPYHQQFDVNRIVAAGNSCGGIVSLALASMDDRVKSVFVLSGSSGFTEQTAAAVMGNILVPVGYIVGGDEDIANRFARQDLAFLPQGVPSYFVERFEGDHVLVSTDPDILLDVAAISTNWIDFTLYGNPAVRRALTDSPCENCDGVTWLVEADSLELHTPP